MSGQSQSKENKSSFQESDRLATDPGHDPTGDRLGRITPDSSGHKPTK